MDLSSSAESRAIRDTVAELVADLPGGSVDGDDEHLDGQSTQLGLTGLLVTEKAGGVGQDLPTAALVLETLGRRTTRRPWVADLVAVPWAAAHLTDVERSHSLLGAIAAGDRRLAFGRPLADGPPEAMRVDLTSEAVALGHASLAIWSGGSWHRDPRTDLTGSADLWTTSSAPAETLAITPDRVRSTIAAARTGAAAFVLGSGRAALDLAVEHARGREQFGRPIGSFQSVKHLLAASLERLVMAAPLVTVAAVAVDDTHDSASCDAAVALRQCSAAAAGAARAAIQVHGAMGYTDEVPLGGLLAQIQWTTWFWGPSGQLSDHVAESLVAGQHLGDLVGVDG